MNTHADTTQDNKSQSVANEVSQKQNSGESTFQFVDNRPEAFAQRKIQELAKNSPQAKQTAQLQGMADNHSAQQPKPIQKKENNTGLPDNLKSGIENLSGFSMDDVKVHYNSNKPAQLQAHAYAKGTDIHLASGQEKHLPHEAWHVVQQKQGRVKPTMQSHGLPVNDSPTLEKEADKMGSDVVKQFVIQRKEVDLKRGLSIGQEIIQAIIDSAAFRIQTPGTLFRPRRTVDAIDTALDNYHSAAQGNKLATLGALLNAVSTYRASKTPDPADARLTAVNNLRKAILDEQPLVIRLDLLSQHGVTANLENIGTAAAISDQELTELAQLEQVTDVAELVQLHGLARVHAETMVLAAIQYRGVRPSLQQIINLDGFALARIQTLAEANLAQAGTWAELERLIAIDDWNERNIVTFANTEFGGATPTLQQMEQISAFSFPEIGKLKKAGSWEKIMKFAKIHSAPINQDPSEDVTTAMGGVGVNEVKANVAGVVDETRSCWNWATQGFEAPEVPDNTIFSYFSLRTNFPPVYDRLRDHAQTVNFLAGSPAANDPIRVYLNRNQGALQGIVATWQANHLVHAQQANQAAQLELMRLHLTESGFHVLPQGTDSRWYICMHELKNNVGWEHWWIKTRAGDVIETFPGTADGRGKFIAFHQSDVNMGDTNRDFRHEVPVANLLPAQLAIIRRALGVMKGKIAKAIGPK